MKKSILLLLRIVFTGGILFLASCSDSNDWVMFRGENGQGRTSSVVMPPIALKWKLKLQQEVDAARYFNPPIILDGIIYFGSFDGNFYALDIETGYMRWVFKTGDRINSIPYADKDNVYFGSDDGILYAVSKDTGEEIWSYATGEQVQSLVAKYRDQIVFVTNATGKGYFLDTKGRLVNSIPNTSWQKYTFQIYDDILYFAPGDENGETGLTAYNIADRHYLWSLNDVILHAYWYSVPAIENKSLYMATCITDANGFLYHYYSVDRFTGDVLWETSTESDLADNGNLDPNTMLLDYSELLDYMAPSIWQNLVIYTSGDRKVRAFDKRTGRIAWEHTFNYHTSSSPTVSGDRIYFGIDGNDGDYYGHLGDVPPKLVCLNASDGRLLWEIPIDGKVMSAPVIAGKWMVFGTDKHYFYVLEEVF